MLMCDDDHHQGKCLHEACVPDPGNAGASVGTNKTRAQKICVADKDGIDSTDAPNRMKLLK
jgi:hypothetical protein